MVEKSRNHCQMSSKHKKKTDALALCFRFISLFCFNSRFSYTGKAEIVQIFFSNTRIFPSSGPESCFSNLFVYQRKHNNLRNDLKIISFAEPFLQSKLDTNNPNARL